MTQLRWTTAGESHGMALVGIVEGLPAGLALDLDRVNAELARRQQGYGRGGRMRIETDTIELLSGVRAGKTLGSPLAFTIQNKDQTIERLPVPTNPRPGHADLAGCFKLGERDPRAVLERASARETATRVACGALARQVLEHFGIDVFAHVVELGGVATRGEERARVLALPRADRDAVRASSAFFALDAVAEPALTAVVDRAKEAGDTLGGVFEVVATGLPPGLGSYHSGPERLTARLGGALFSIPAMKGVEFGLGFESARRPGSQVHDAILGAPSAEAGGQASSSGGSGPLGTRYRRATNHAGGLEGGMTTGEPLILRVAMKPIPTLRRGLPTVEFETLEEVQATYQRSDVTSVPAASVVGEALTALVLTQVFLERFGGDALEQVEGAWRAAAERARAL
ncbi:MAG: chorismate synthase [Planctomycetes bacterium]|nr:chorismate synthase [Planctomycetota bacterium]